MPASGRAAASSKVSASGIASSSAAGAATYSAKPPPAPPTSPYTLSPGFHRVTSAPTASTSPAMSLPRIGARGPVRPNIFGAASRARYGSPRITCQSRALTAAAWTRTST